MLIRWVKSRKISKHLHSAVHYNEITTTNVSVHYVPQVKEKITHLAHASLERERDIAVSYLE